MIRSQVVSIGCARICVGLGALGAYFVQKAEFMAKSELQDGRGGMSSIATDILWWEQGPIPAFKILQIFWLEDPYCDTYFGFLRSQVC